MAFPMQNNQWAQYFEDIQVFNDTHNRNQLVAGETAKYLLRHPEADPAWQSHVTGIVAWVESTFGKPLVGTARPIGEQIEFNIEMGSHTARYAAVNALLYEATGSTASRDKAYRAFNWASYITWPDGHNNTGEGYSGIWFTDGYGDTVRNFMIGLGAVPEWSPNGEAHLTRSTRWCGRWLHRQPGQLHDLRRGRDRSHAPTRAADPGHRGRRAARPRPDLAAEGFTWDATNGVLRVRHDSATSIAVSW